MTIARKSIWTLHSVNFEARKLEEIKRIRLEKLQVTDWMAKRNQITQLVILKLGDNH